MGCITTKSSKRQSKSTSTHRSSFSALISINHSSILDDYTLSRQLGEGGFGNVREAISKDTGVHRAVKTIHISKNSSLTVTSILQEVQILKAIDHPGVIKIFEVYQDAEKLHIVTELCTGGDLFHRVQARGYLSENFAAKLLFDIASAVKYCHQAGVVHRDLKPENILFEDKSPDSRIKLIDFGGSKFNELEKMKTFMGTAYYIAPEVISGDYTEKCDVWSIGVILYIMLCGKPPYCGKSFEEIFNNILKKEVKFEGSAWRHVSDSCKNLLRKLLEKNPKNRISVSELLYSPWITTRSKDLVPDRSQGKRIFDRFVQFKCTNKLQMCILAFLTHQSATNEKIRSLRELFEQIDKNKDGKLSRDEIKEAMHDYGNTLKLNVDQIFEQCDFDQNGFIEFSEFVTAVQSKELEYTRHNLRKAFLALDKNGDGKISKDEVKEVLNELDEDCINQVFKQLDKDGSGEIDDEEFFEAFAQYSACQETESDN